MRGLHFVFTKRRFSDFTFFKLIFIDKSKLTENDLDQIIAHERVHIKQYHTLDLIFVELLTIFQWFNPFVWLYKRSIKETHEYLADDAVIAQGCDTAKYQLLIFERFVGVRLFDLANNFHQSQIKRRITMMTKHKSRGRAKYKVLLILPVLSFLVLAFAEPRILTQEKQVKKLREEKIKLLKKEYEAIKKEIEAGGDGEEIKEKKEALEKKIMALKKEEEFIKMKKKEGDGRLYELELAAKFKSERKKVKEMVAKAETEEEKEALMEKMRKLDEKEKAMKKELAKRREMEKKKKEEELKKKKELKEQKAQEEKEKSTKKKVIEM